VRGIRVAISEKQRLFVQAYMGVALGNATKAAAEAGYRHPATMGSRQLQKVEVQKAIEKRQEKDPKIATAEGIRRFWVNMMTDPEASRGIKLKASDLLAKSKGMYLERSLHVVSVVVSPSVELETALALISSVGPEVIDVGCEVLEIPADLATGPPEAQGGALIGSIASIEAESKSRTDDPGPSPAEDARLLDTSLADPDSTHS
jgi:hypothetical protein